MENKEVLVVGVELGGANVMAGVENVGGEGAVF